MEYIYTTAYTSSSVTYGNVASFIKNYIISKFPQNFFKYKTISTELSYRNILQQLKESENLELSKRHKPYLIVKPMIQSMNNGDLYLFDTPMTKNYFDIEYGMDKRHLFPVIKDKENGYNLLFKLNRDKFEFDITVTVGTLIQQIDWYKYMLNEFTWENPMAMSTAFEALIPRDIIFHISNLINIPLNEETNIKQFLNKLNQYSAYPITYKMRNATSKDEFFMYYNHQLLVTLTDLTIEEGNKKDMVDDTYNITFHISTEFNLPGSFILTGTKPDLYNASLKLLVKDDINNKTDSMHICPLYTMHNMFSDFTSRIDGFRLLISSIVAIDKKNKSGKEIADLSGIFSKEETKVIKDNIGFISNVDTLVRVIMTEDGIPMDKDRYYVDWNTMQLHFFDVEPTSTYRVFIYQNSIKFNDAIIENMDNKNLNT